MAQTVNIIVKVDGKDIDVAKLSLTEFNKQVGDLKKQLNDTPVGTDKFKQLNGEINELEKGFRKAKDAQQPFLQSMAELDGALGYVGRSINGVGEAMTLLSENPLIAAMGLLAGGIALVVKQTEKFVGVEEELNIAEKELGVTTNAITQKYFSGLGDIIKNATSWFSELIEKYREWAGLSQESGKSTYESFKELAAIERSVANIEIERVKIQSKLLEAREKLIDPSLDPKEKKKALEETKQLEQDLSKTIIEENTKRLSAVTNILATTKQDIGGNFVDINRQIVAMGKDLDLNKLIPGTERTYLSFLQDEFKAMKDVIGVEGDKTTKDEENMITFAQGLIKNFYLEKGRLAAADRRLQVGLNNLNKKDVKEQTAEEKLAEEQKDNYKTLGLELRKKIREEEAKDEITKLRASTKNEEETMLASIVKAKLTNDQRIELMNQYFQYVKDKEAKTGEEIGKLQDKQFDKSFKDQQEQDNNIIKAAKIKYQTLKLMYGEDSDEAKKSLEEQYKLEDKFYKAQIQMLYDKQSAGYDLTEEELNELGKLKTALKQLDFDKTQSSLLDGKIYKQFELETKNYQNLYLGKKKFTSEFYDHEKQLIKDSLDANEKAYKKKLITEKEYNDNKQKFTYANIQLEASATKAQEDNFKIIGDAFGVASQLLGESTAEGKAMAIAQATIDTYAAANKALDTYDPPFSFIAAATTIAAGLLNVNRILSVQVPGTASSTGNAGNSAANLTAGYAAYGDGGLIDGPRHAGGGVMINAEGGEAVMTRGAVTMFGPLLSKLNQMGGGTSFQKELTGEAKYDVPQPAEATIMKTYVVSHELTSQAEKSARLKNLSVL